MARLQMRLLVVAALVLLFAVTSTALADSTLTTIDESKSDAALLAEQRVEPTREGVTTFLQQFKSELTQAKKAEENVRQLGDDNFRVRETASQRLIDGRSIPLKALQQATTAADPEVAARSKRILSHPRVADKVARAEDLPRIGAAVFRTIQRKVIRGTTPGLFDVIECLDDPELRDVASETVAEIAGPDDAPLLERNLASKNLDLRVAAIRGLADVKVKADADLRAMLDDVEPRIALAAAHTLAQHGDRTAIGALVRLTSSKNERVRARSEQILRAWTGRNFDFDPYQDPATQKEQLERWRNWLVGDGRTAKLNQPFHLAPLPEDLRVGLLAHYTFDHAVDGRLIDSSGHKRHGTLHNEHSLIAGLAGKALQVRGAGDMGDQGGHALLPFIDFTKLEQFTLVMWVYERGMTDGHGEAYVVYGADRGVVTEDSLGISHFNESIFYRVGAAQVIAPYEAADRNRWVHYALTFQAGRLQAYKDGRLVGEAKGRVVIVGKQAALGRHWWGHGEATSTRFNGAFDELRIYQRALAPSQIKLLHSSLERK